MQKKASSKAKGIIDKKLMIEAAKIAERDNLFYNYDNSSFFIQGSC